MISLDRILVLVHTQLRAPHLSLDPEHVVQKEGLVDRGAHHVLSQDRAMDLQAGIVLAAEAVLMPAELRSVDPGHSQMPAELRSGDRVQSQVPAELRSEDRGQKEMKKPEGRDWWQMRRTK